MDRKRGRLIEVLLCLFSLPHWKDNAAHSLRYLMHQKLLNLDAVDYGWIGWIRGCFAGKALRLKVDDSKSLRAIVKDLIETAFKRQEECPGRVIAEAVMQHLVGAKLEIAVPTVNIEHRGFAIADTTSNWPSDFLVRDTAIHVTTAPKEALIRKCVHNLDNNLRPVIITTESGVGGARALARDAGVDDQIDVLEIEQFVAANIYSWGGFSHGKRQDSLSYLVAKYNAIVKRCETDPRLRISLV